MNTALDVNHILPVQKCIWLVNFYQYVFVRLCHILQLLSDINYKNHYDKHVKGTTLAKTMESYPEYQQAMIASKNLSQVINCLLKYNI